MTDTSKDAVERLADELPETNWGAPRLYRAVDTFRALLAEREALTAEVARLKSDRSALEEQSIRDRKSANDAMHDATMWQFSIDDGAHDGQSLLVKVWKQRKEADRRTAEAKAEVARLTAALEFYGNAWGFKTNKRYGGLEWFPTEELLDDCGNTAKDALAAHAARREGGV